MELRFAASLAEEREARGELQKQLENLHLKLQKKQESQSKRRAASHAEAVVDTANGAFRVTLTKESQEQKYGLQLRQREGEGTVTVASIVPGSLAAACQKICVGDEVCAISCSL